MILGIGHHYSLKKNIFRGALQNQGNIDWTYSFLFKWMWFAVENGFIANVETILMEQSLKKFVSILGQATLPEMCQTNPISVVYIKKGTLLEGCFREK